MLLEILSKANNTMTNFMDKLWFNCVYKFICKSLTCKNGSFYSFTALKIRNFVNCIRRHIACRCRLCSANSINFRMLGQKQLVEEKLHNTCLYFETIFWRTKLNLKFSDSLEVISVWDSIWQKVWTKTIKFIYMIIKHQTISYIFLYVFSVQNKLANINSLTWNSYVQCIEEERKFSSQAVLQ